MPIMSYDESAKQPFLNHDEDRSDSLDVHRRALGNDSRISYARCFTIILMISYIPTIVTLIYLLLRLSQCAHEQECAHPELVPCKYQPEKK